MDSYKVNKKNAFKFTYVKSVIEKSLSNYKGKYIIIKITVVCEVIYGTSIGYKFRKVEVPKKIENISATKIRKLLLKNEKEIY